MFWNPQDLLYMMATEIIEIDASWAEKWTKTGVPFLSAPTVDNTVTLYNSVKMLPDESSLAISTSSYIFSIPINNADTEYCM